MGLLHLIRVVMHTRKDDAPLELVGMAHLQGLFGNTLGKHPLSTARLITRAVRPCSVTIEAINTCVPIDRQAIKASAPRYFSVAFCRLKLFIGSMPFVPYMRDSKSLRH